MHKLCISIVVALASLALDQGNSSADKQQAQKTPGKPPANLLAIDYGDFTVKPPAGQEWQMTRDPRQTSGSLVDFDNPKLKAWASVEQALSREPVTDIHAKLLLLGENMRRTYESNSRIIRFETIVRTIDQRECLFTTAIVNPKQAIPGVPANVNQVLHTCNCFYRDSTDHKDYLVGLLYGNAVDGESDPQKEQAEGFFAGLHFKAAK